MGQGAVVLAADATADLGAGNASLKALTILLGAVGPLAVAAPHVRELRFTLGRFGFEFWVEGSSVPGEFVLDGVATLSGILGSVVAVSTLASVTQNIGRKTLAVQLQTLGAFAVALLGRSSKWLQLVHRRRGAGCGGLGGESRRRCGGC